MYKSMVGFWRASLASTCSRRGLCLKSRAGNSRSPKAPKMVRTPSLKSLRRAVSLALVVALCSLPALAGIVVTGTQGLTMTGADGIYYDNVSGLNLTGADALTYQVNGIYGTTTPSGLTMTGADASPVATVDGVSYTGTNSYAAAHADGLNLTGADGLNLTGADGLNLTGADGTTWRVSSVTFRQPQGLNLTGADGLNLTGADGLNLTGAD